MFDDQEPQAITKAAIMLDLCLGNYVTNPLKPGWGPGKVVHVRNGTAFVFFREYVEHRRALKFKVDQLRLAEDQSDPILDNLPPFVEKNGEFLLPSDRITFDMAVAKFLEVYPGGFYDPIYESPGKAGERGYKVAACDRYEQVLGNGKGEALLAAGRVGDLVACTKKIEGPLNLLAVQEKSAFKEGLEDLDAARRFFQALFPAIIGGPNAETFNRLVDAVAALPARGATSTDKWTIATLLPFLARPDTFIFVKPSITKNAAERLGFDIRYDAHPNWQTYAAVLRMSDIYRDKLASWKPRDFIDVQSFFWVTADLYDITVQRRKAAQNK